MAYLLERLAAGEDGATTVEYALMAVMIGAALVAVVRSLGASIGDRLAAMSSAIGGPYTVGSPYTTVAP